MHADLKERLAQMAFVMYDRKNHLFVAYNGSQTCLVINENGEDVGIWTYDHKPTLEYITKAMHNMIDHEEYERVWA